MINVADFGAIGDGVTDNTAALQAAFNAAMALHPPGGGYGAKVCIPSGAYCTKDLQLYRSDGAQVSLVIEGDSTLSTILKYTGGNGNLLATSIMKYFAIKNLQLSQSGPPGLSTGLWMTNLGSPGNTGTNAGTLENLLCVGFATGFDAGQCSSEITYINCAATSCTVGFYVPSWNCLNHTLINAQFSACGTGFKCTQGGNINFFGGSSAGNGIDFDIESPTNFMIHGWRSQQGSSYFLKLAPSGTAWLSLDGCNVVGNGLTPAISLRGTFQAGIRNSFVGGPITYQGGLNSDLTLEDCGIFDTVPFEVPGQAGGTYRVKGCGQVQGAGNSNTIARFVDEEGYVGLPPGSGTYQKISTLQLVQSGVLGANRQNMLLPNLLTANPHVAGEVWSNAGILSVSAG